jgi:GAF domain-containing protein
MDLAPVAATEPQRLAALRSTGLLETPPDPAFDELVTLTARLLGAPIAAFNLVDADRQWTKSGFGMDNGDQAPRADSFCAHAIAAGNSPLVIPDTAADPRFADNAMGLGFYAGTPVTAGGQRIGTLCVAGEQAREPRPRTSWRRCACSPRRSPPTSSSPAASANAPRRPRPCDASAS